MHGKLPAKINLDLMNARPAENGDFAARSGVSLEVRIQLCRANIVFVACLYPFIRAGERQGWDGKNFSFSFCFAQTRFITWALGEIHAL